METTQLTQAESTRLMRVLKDLAGDTATDKFVEHRRHKRRPVAMGVWVRLISPGRARHPLCRVLLTNISARGLCLIAPRPITVGDRVVLRLPFQEGGGWLVLATIRNCNANPGGTFRAGAEFVCWVDDPNGETPVPRDWVTSWN